MLYIMKFLSHKLGANLVGLIKLKGKNHQWPNSTRCGYVIKWLNENHSCTIYELVFEQKNINPELRKSNWNQTRKH